MPLQRRLPKRGFRNPFEKRFTIIHIKDLNRYARDTVVDPDLLSQSGFMKKGEEVKLLSDGELQYPLTIRVHKVSKAALKKVEAASGKVEVIGS